MTWATKITLDAASNTSGVVSATWNSGGSDEFTYSARHDTDSFVAADFKSAAEAARDAFLTKRTLVASKETALANYMNGV